MQTINNLQYVDIIKPVYLSKEFLAKYATKKAPFPTVFGLVVFLRTYSRFIPQLKRREYWWETVARVVDYSMSLYKGPASYESLKQEAEELYDGVYTLKVFPAGRSLWVGGTNVVEKNGTANFNCSFRVKDNIEAFSEIFYLLLVGAGTGFSVENKYVKQLPKLNSKVEILHQNYNPLPKAVREEFTQVSLKAEGYQKTFNLREDYIVDSTNTILESAILDKPNTLATIEFGDSKFGWVGGLKAYLHLLTSPNIKAITFVYDSVRPAGERLLTMGGRASGPEPLKKMFEKIDWTIKHYKGILNSVATMDICNFIAEGVVVGGVRRSSQIALGDWDDKDFVDAKFNLWSGGILDKGLLTDNFNLGNETKTLINLLSQINLNVNLETLEEKWSKKKNSEPWLSGVPLDLVLEQFGGDHKFLWSNLPKYKQIESFIDNLDPKFRYRASRVMSNNSIHLYFNPGLEALKEIFSRIESNGEPGIYIAENATKRRPNYKGTNPCFTGDMKLLTDKGYIEFKELKNQPVKVVNKDGNITESKVWCSGTKKCIEVKLSNKQTLKCTPDHVWLTPEGEVEAKNLKNKQVIPFLKEPNLNIDYIRYGFIQGDGVLSRLTSDTHKGIEVNIGYKDQDIYSLFENLNYSQNNRSIYFNDSKDIEVIKSLGYKKVSLPERTLPDSFNSFNLTQKASFLKGCFSANGSVLSCGRVTYKSTCKQLLEEIQEVLFLEFNIESYITTNKAKEVQFKNGVYFCKKSYDLNINKFIDKVNFFNSIGFVQQYKTTLLAQHLLESAPYVTSIKDIGEHKVYDFTEPETSWGVVNNFIAHNCSEILLDNQGVCNLTEVNVHAFVKGINDFDYEGFYKAVKLATRAGSRITNVDMWHPEWDKVQKRDRLLGASLTGQVEAWDALGWGYIIDEKGNYKYINDTRIDTVLEKAKLVERQEADSYHEEMSIPKALLISTGKPSGTIAQLPSVSSGCHRPYAPYYLRRIRISKFDPVAKSLRKLGVPVVPENKQGTDLDAEQCNTWVFTFPMKTSAPIRAIDESAIDQLKRYQTLMQKYIEHNQSITITVAGAKYDENYNEIAPSEWSIVAEWVANPDNWKDIVGVSFLPKWDPTEGSESIYPNLPYQPSYKEEFNQYSSLTSLSEENLVTLISEYERDEYLETELDKDCTTGCPIR